MSLKVPLLCPVGSSQKHLKKSSAKTPPQSGRSGLQINSTEDLGPLLNLLQRQQDACLKQPYSHKASQAKPLKMPMTGPGKMTPSFLTRYSSHLSETMQKAKPGNQKTTAYGISFYLKANRKPVTNSCTKAEDPRLLD